MTYIDGVNWQYVKDPNEINEAIASNDENFEGLKSSFQIINITYDTNHGCYVVFWRCETEVDLSKLHKKSEAN